MSSPPLAGEQPRMWCWWLEEWLPADHPGDEGICDEIVERLPEQEVLAVLHVLAWADATMLPNPYQDWHTWESDVGARSDILLAEARGAMREGIV